MNSLDHESFDRLLLALYDGCDERPYVETVMEAERIRSAFAHLELDHERSYVSRRIVSLLLRVAVSTMQPDDTVEELYRTCDAIGFVGVHDIVGAVMDYAEYCGRCPSRLKRGLSELCKTRIRLIAIRRADGSVSEKVFAPVDAMISRFRDAIRDGTT